MELDVLGPKLAGTVGRGHELGVEVLGQVLQSRHPALHVDRHEVYSTGHDSQLLVQEAARGRDAVAHENLVGGAAQAGNLYALGACLLGLGDELRVTRGLGDHLREDRLVAVDHDVDLVGLDGAQVCLRPQRLGAAEDDVLDVGGDHGAAPAVRQGTAHALLHEADAVGVDSHVGLVERRDDLAVDAARDQTVLAPELLALLRCAGYVGELAVLLAELGQRRLADLLGERPRVLALGVNAEVLGHLPELLLVFDSIVAVALGGLQQRVGGGATVVRVSRAANRDLPQEVSGRYHVCVRATDADLGAVAEWVNAAWAHLADRAAYPKLTKTTLRLHLIESIPRRRDLLLLRPVEHLQAGRVNRPLIGCAHVALLRRVL